MGKAKGKHRLDNFYRLAKEQGYRSRAAFKLTQLDAKFRFLHSARAVLDLCAAPGGWMQVAAGRVAAGSFVLGVDLFPIRPIRGAVSLEEDITTQRCRSSIRKLMNDHACSAFDVVLHDGSPNVGGAWAQEATAQAVLVVESIRLAVNFLAPKGTFVTKVFRSQDYSAILFCLKQLFEKVEVTKPVASRSTSAEIYVIGLKYKAPAKVDPRLLDFKHLFQGAIDPPKVVDVLRGTKQKRNREGYEDGITTLRKVCIASDFIWSETPLDILGSVTAISFDDPACSTIRNHELTSDEIKFLCDDLGVLGKQDFKNILKWRMRLRKALSPTQKVESKAADAEEGTKGNDDDTILNEMEELTYALERKKKREKKLLAKRRSKDKARKATGMQIDVMEDEYVDCELFSLSSIKGKKELGVVESSEFNHEDDHVIGDDEEEETPAAAYQGDSPTDADTDEELRRYDDQLEDILDQAYENYVTRKEGSSKHRKRVRQALANKNEDLFKDDAEDAVIHSDHDSDMDVDNEANPLVVPLHQEEQLTQEEITKRWFSQDIFAEVAEDGGMEKNDSDDDNVEQVRSKVSATAKSKENKAHSNDLSVSQAQDSKTDDFEIVPAERTDSSGDSSSSEESEIDDDAKAEILAYAKKMLRKKQREQILDDAYNKYIFDDEGLPTWFIEEERKHRQPMKPVTKEEVAAMRAQFREIDARPAKKVAQAKARRKRDAMRKLDKARQKANSISDQTDISDRSKRKMIDRLYKKAMPKKPQKEYVVAKKGVQVKPGKGKKLVDRRMKKDARTRGMGKSGKGGKNVKGKLAKGQRGKGPAKKAKGN